MGCSHNTAKWADECYECRANRLEQEVSLLRKELRQRPELSPEHVAQYLIGEAPGAAIVNATLRAFAASCLPMMAAVLPPCPICKQIPAYPLHDNLRASYAIKCDCGKSPKFSATSEHEAIRGWCNYARQAGKASSHKR